MVGDRIVVISTFEKDDNGEFFPIESTVVSDGDFLRAILSGMARHLRAIGMPWVTRVVAETTDPNKTHSSYDA